MRAMRAAGWALIVVGVATCAIGLSEEAPPCGEDGATDASCAVPSRGLGLAVIGATLAFAGLALLAALRRPRIP